MDLIYLRITLVCPGIISNKPQFICGLNKWRGYVWFGTHFVQIILVQGTSKLLLKIQNVLQEVIMKA